MKSTQAFATPIWIETSRQAQCSKSSLSSRRPLWTTLSYSKSRLCGGSSRNVITASDPLVLSEDNVQLVLDEAKNKLGSIFGNSSENRGVGITGDVEVASLDGPFVILRLKGRFWHKRADVVSNSSPLHILCLLVVFCSV